jgi:hypothetical protein
MARISSISSRDFSFGDLSIPALFLSIAVMSIEGMCVEELVQICEGVELTGILKLHLLLGGHP